MAKRTGTLKLANAPAGPDNPPRIDYLRVHEDSEEPNELWMQDTVEGCIARALAIVDAIGQCGTHDASLLPGTLSGVCDAARYELFAAQEAFEKHRYRMAHPKQEVADE